MIIDNILVDWQSSKKVISFPTLVISFVRSYQFSDTCHSNNSSHISDQCGQKKFICFCWPIIFYSWCIFWDHMVLGTSKNIIIYLWFTLNVMYPNEACYTYQFCEIFSISAPYSTCDKHFQGRELIDYLEILVLLIMEVFLPLSTILVNKLDGVVGKVCICLVF